MDTIPRKSPVTQIYLLGLGFSPSKLSELFPSSQQIAKSTDLISFAFLVRFDTIDLLFFREGVSF